MKKVVTIQDISCFGKCSITVALPLISAMGIECAIIPTSVLSTHTGGFEGFTFRDLSEDIPKIKEHWKKYALSFDAIYTGYLGSHSQIDYVIDFIKDFKKDGTVVFVDPAMGDKGKLYTGFDDAFPAHMAKLCASADIIVPNLTEAAFMLGREYKEHYDEQYVHDTLKALCKMGAKKAVLTGISYDKTTQGAVLYNSEDDSFYSYFNEHIPVSFHGTGDTFASVFIGALTHFGDEKKALEMAVDFTVECIRSTLPEKESHSYGTKFEERISYLIDLIKKYEE
ncbi:MAG: pyridoxamine kinase [Clostridia bacterium]|nr:pyridoxamine kinase [Clostridia bacterium]